MEICRTFQLFRLTITTRYNHLRVAARQEQLLSQKGMLLCSKLMNVFDTIMKLGRRASETQKMHHHTNDNNNQPSRNRFKCITLNAPSFQLFTPTLHVFVCCTSFASLTKAIRRLKRRKDEKKCHETRRSYRKAIRESIQFFPSEEKLPESSHKLSKALKFRLG